MLGGLPPLEHRGGDRQSTVDSRGKSMGREQPGKPKVLLGELVPTCPAVHPALRAVGGSALPTGRCIHVLSRGPVCSHRRPFHTSPHF